MKHNFTLDLTGGGVAYFLFGEDEMSFYVLIFLFIVNMILGITKGLKEKTFKMSILRDSMLKFMAILLVLITFSVIGKLNGVVIEKANNLNPFLMTFFLIYYLGSIIENAVALGVPFPKKIIDSIKNKFVDLENKE